MVVYDLAVKVALLSDLIEFLEGNNVGIESAFGACRFCSFGCLPQAYRDAFAACLADEVKLLRVKRSATSKRLRKELLCWVDELTHIVLSPNSELGGIVPPKQVLGGTKEKYVEEELRQEILDLKIMFYAAVKSNGGKIIIKDDDIRSIGYNAELRRFDDSINRRVIFILNS